MKSPAVNFALSLFDAHFTTAAYARHLHLCGRPRVKKRGEEELRFINFVGIFILFC